MKQLVVFILAILFSENALCSAKTYTLEGYVRGMYGDSEAISRAGIAYGDYIKYVVVVDKSRRGFSDNNGNITFANSVEVTETESFENYYAELVESSHQIQSTYYGWDDINYIGTDVDSPSYPEGPFTRLTVGPTMLYIDSLRYIEFWEVGEELGGAYLWHDQDNGMYATMHLSLNVTYIEESNDVPNVSVTPEKKRKKKSGGSFDFSLLVLVALWASIGKLHNKSFKPTALRAAA